MEVQDNATTEVIKLTQAAAEEVRSMRVTQPENAGKPLRVYVEKGGCSGMQYGLVFDEYREGDQVDKQRDVEVIVDSFSANYLRGAVVDFSDSLSGGGFKISNPNARESCGCGRSFHG